MMNRRRARALGTRTRTLTGKIEFQRDGKDCLPLQVFFKPFSVKADFRHRRDFKTRAIGLFLGLYTLCFIAIDGFIMIHRAILLEDNRNKCEQWAGMAKKCMFVCSMNF
jgi:hypothetical protein